MKRDRRETEEKLVRTTLLLPENLVRHLDLLAIEEGVAKGELIGTALKNFILKRKPNWDISKAPQVEAIYE